MNTVTKELWGTAPDGTEIYLYTLKNASGAYFVRCFTKWKGVSPGKWRK